MFSVTRNRFRNRKQLARKGVENSSEVVVFYRALCAETDFPAAIGSSPFSLEIGFAEPRFCTLPHKKRGKSCWIYPGKRLDSIQILSNKMPDLPFSFVNSVLLLRARLHKIEGYNTCFPTYQKEVPDTCCGGG